MMKLNTQSMCVVALFTVVLIVSAFIKIPISIVPVTMQTFAVILCGLLLERRLSVLAVSLYVFMGLLGLPVFANGGGLVYILQPSFGYLMGFLAAVYFIGTFSKKKDSYVKTFMISIIAILIIYSFGLSYFVGLQSAYFSKPLDFGWIFYFLFLVYLPGDVIACIIASYLKSRISKAKYY